MKLNKIESFRPIAFLKVFIFILGGVSSIFQVHNMILVDTLAREIEDNYIHIYSFIRRFGSYYNNTLSSEYPQGSFEQDGVSILIKDETAQVKDLSKGMVNMREHLQEYSLGNIWTVAVFENPTSYAHFLPLRDIYKERFDHYSEDSTMEKIVLGEGLSHTYRSFYGCNLRISDSYVEAGTGEQIRTIYYPIHNEQALKAVVAVDIKNSHIHDLVSRFNDNHYSVLKVDDPQSSYSASTPIRCANNEHYQIGIVYQDVLKWALLPSLLLSALYQFIATLLARRGRSIRMDEMTGLYRRDYCEPRFKRLEEFALLVIDIDHFKQINDTHGHTKGDEVLAECARIIRSQIRHEDVAARWGGEEFLIQFKEMEKCVLFDKAEQIRMAIANEPIAGIPVTISIGGISIKESNFASAYKQADAALYQSKNRGRNKVTIA